MKLTTITIALAMLASPVFAGDWGQRNSNFNVNQSSSHSRSSARAEGGNATNSGVNNSTSFRDRLQAPGFGVGGGYCSNGLSISFPGGGFGFSSMERACKTEISARVARTYLGPQAAAQYVCTQYEFRSLAACRRR